MNVICSYFIFLSPKLTNFVLKHKKRLLISSQIHNKAAKNDLHMTNKAVRDALNNIMF